MSHATAIALEPALDWTVSAAVPAEWGTHILRCGGGYFHSPLAVLDPDAGRQPIYCTLWRDDEVIGIAAGLRHGCRLSPHPGHVYFPSAPAIVDPADRAPAARMLIELLRLDGASEVTLDSFDAQWSVDPAGASAAVARREHVLPLDVPAEEITARCADHHRRNVRRGERSAWTQRLLTGNEAAAAIVAVQDAAKARSAKRGTPFASRPPAALRRLTTDLHQAWGATVVSTWAADEMLAAGLVGWAGRRAYFVMGGSTPEGYDRGAAVWHHWRTMQTLREMGFVQYNLGGAPAAVAENPAVTDGLRRFKLGFGSLPMECCSTRWTLRRAHTRAHDLRGLFAQWTGL